MGQVTVLKVVEGRANITLRIAFIGDGTGDLVDEVIFSPEDLAEVPVPKNIPTFRLLQAWYGLVTFDVDLKVGTRPKSPLWSFGRKTGTHVDFRSFGGLIDPDVEIYSVQPPDTDGKLLISTEGLVDGAIGHLVLSLALTNAAASERS